jgi:hypothetical protein
MPQTFWPEPDSKRIDPIIRCIHDRVAARVYVMETFSGESFGVTVIATGCDLRAASDRIPRSVGPFDSGSQTHR